MSEKSFEGLLGKAAQVGDAIRKAAKEGSYILVVSHHDADGIAAAGIMGAALTRLGSRFHISVVNDLNEEALRELAEVEPDLWVFTDVGSGQLSMLAGALPATPTLIVDHHPPEMEAPEGFAQLNPHDFGLQGATDVSAAGLAYFVVRSISEDNLDLAPLAVVGALGDMQDKNADRALRGLNRLIVDDGLKSGLLRADVDLILYGRETRPIHKALAHTTTPYFPGLSGNEEGCLSLLSSTGIPLKDGERWRTVADLTLEEKRRLLDFIIDYLLKKGYRAGEAINLIGTVYTLTKEQPGSILRDAREFAASLNACGRMGKAGLGVALCMGNREAAYEEALEVVTSYRRTLAGYMRWLADSPGAKQETRSMVIVRGEEVVSESMTGAFSSILSSSGQFGEERAIIVLANAGPEGVRLSARAPQAMVKKGVDLGLALKETAKKFGGHGGGHNVAAGASVPRAALERFLKELDEAISRQVGAG